MLLTRRSERGQHHGLQNRQYRHRPLRPRRSTRPLATCPPSPAAACSFFPKGGVYLTGPGGDEEQRQVLTSRPEPLLKGPPRMPTTSLPPPPATQRSRQKGGSARCSSLRMSRMQHHGPRKPSTRRAIRGCGTISNPTWGMGRPRTPEGLVNDPHGSGVKGYTVSNCKNVTFQDLFLLRSSYWTVDRK